MNILVTASRTLVGLFVDDGSLAIAILVIVLVSGIFSILMPDARRWRCAFNWMPCRAFRQCHESGTGLATKNRPAGVWSELGPGCHPVAEDARTSSIRSSPSARREDSRVDVSILAALRSVEAEAG